MYVCLNWLNSFYILYIWIDHWISFPSSIFHVLSHNLWWIQLLHFQIYLFSLIFADVCYYEIESSRMVFDRITGITFSAIKSATMPQQGPSSQEQSSTTPQHQSGTQTGSSNDAKRASPVNMSNIPQTPAISKHITSVASQEKATIPKSESCFWDPDGYKPVSFDIAINKGCFEGGFVFFIFFVSVAALVVCLLLTFRLIFLQFWINLIFLHTRSKWRANQTINEHSHTSCFSYTGCKKIWWFIVFPWASECLLSSCPRSFAQPTNYKFIDFNRIGLNSDTNFHSLSFNCPLYFQVFTHTYNLSINTRIA